MASPLASFFAGGFETAAHRRADRLQLDLIRDSNHDLYAETDYRLLRRAGIRTVRDGLRWHLIESRSGVYDWSSFLPMLRASIATKTQVIWDLCHWGIPADLDLFSLDFVERFAAFAYASASLIAEHSGDVPLFCPVNEISFWSWVGGGVGAFHPHLTDRADDVKRQLVRASLAAIQAIRTVNPRARFIQPEPLINVVSDQQKPEHRAEARCHTAGQYQAWDWLAADPERRALDIIGVNYYWNNQWVHQGERVSLGHAQHRPFHLMLLDVWNRYQRPILISETGMESMAGASWLAYICAEVRQAQREGAEIIGICLYPVMDYPGWDDNRHCACGLIEVDAEWQSRSLRLDFVAELSCQQRLFPVLPYSEVERDTERELSSVASSGDTRPA